MSIRAHGTERVKAPMAKVEAVKEVRRRQLIDATIWAIGRVGYANATLTHVA